VSLTIPHGPAHIQRLTGAVAQARLSRPSLRVLAGGREALARRPQLEAAGIEVGEEIGIALTPNSGSSTEKMRER
jgi:hypothetical protein